MGDIPADKLACAGYEIVEPLHQTAQNAYAACADQCASQGILGHMKKMKTCAAAVGQRCVIL